MKKVLACIIALSLALSLAACGGGGASESGASASQPVTASTSQAAPDGEPDGKAEFKPFKLGMMDPGAWNAHQGPMYAQMEIAAKALNVELVYATADAQSGEGHIAALQNLIASDCDAVILLNMPMIYGIIPQVADMCESAGVYWALAHTNLVEGDGNYEAAMGSEYFVASTYEDDVYSAYWCSKILGELGCDKLAEIGFASGNATGDMRDQGVEKACAEYDMTILAEERDISLTTTSDGGKTIMDRFIAGYPDMDGLVIAGMSQFVLSGVVSAAEENNLSDSVAVTCIDFHEFQTEYLQSGVLDGIIGGHVVGPLYSLVLIANIMNETPLTEDKLVILDNFIELASYDEALIWDEYGKPGTIYSEKEIKNMMVVYNPDFSLEELYTVVENYSLDDIVARATA